MAYVFRCLHIQCRMASVYAHVLCIKPRTQPNPQIHTQCCMPFLYAMYTHVVMYESEDSNRFLYKGMFNSSACIVYETEDLAKSSDSHTVLYAIPICYVHTCMNLRTQIQSSDSYTMVCLIQVHVLYKNLRT